MKTVARGLFATSTSAAAARWGALVALLAIGVTLAVSSQASALTIRETSDWDYPEDITLSGGYLWLTEPDDDQIIRYTPPIGPRQEFTLPAGTAPLHVAAGPDGNVWFTERNRDVIARMTPSGSLTEFTTGITPGSLPWDIVAGPDGAMWFPEATGWRIARISTSGVVTEYPVGVAPDAITSGPDGNLWFTANNHNQIGRITPAGSVTLFPAPGPTGITTGPDGNIWATSRFDGIIRVTPAGSVTFFTAGITPNAFPREIAPGPDGNLWFTENGIDRLASITTSGVVSEYPLRALSRPTGIVNGQDGSVYFTESGGHHLGRANIFDAPVFLPPGGGGGGGSAGAASGDRPPAAEAESASPAQTVPAPAPPTPVAPPSPVKPTNLNVRPGITSTRDLAARGVPVRLGCDRACVLTATLSLRGHVVGRLKTRLDHPGAQRHRVRLTPAGKRAIARSRAPRLRLRVVATGDDGTTTVRAVVVATRR